MSGSRAHILLIADVPDWIFARHARMLHRFLSDEFDFTLGFAGADVDEDLYDLIYSLEWHLLDRRQIKTPRKHLAGIRSHASWNQLPFEEVIRRLAHDFLRVHVVSARLEAIFRTHLPRVTYLSHGIDTEFFRSSHSVGKGRPLRVGWAGNREGLGKGFLDLVRPLADLDEVELNVCGYRDGLLSIEQMRDFYESIDAYVCASEWEGNNNSLLEAAAMERAIITTDNGTVPEYLKDRENALIVERRLPALIQAVEHLRDDVALRTKLGKAARPAAVMKFDWKARAADHRQFFRESLDVVGRSARPAFRSPTDSDPRPLRVLPARGTELSPWRWMEAFIVEGRGITGVLKGLGIGRIAIFGTGRLGRLLLRDASQSGIDVVGFLDSDPVKRGTKVDGIEVHTPDWLCAETAGIDAVLLSILGDHDREIGRQLESILEGQRLVLSWKNLVVGEIP